MTCYNMGKEVSVLFGPILRVPVHRQLVLFAVVIQQMEDKFCSHLPMFKSSVKVLWHVPCDRP